MREPRNRAERRALAKAVRKAEKLVRIGGRIGVATRFAILDAQGRDVTDERVQPRDT